MAGDWLTLVLAVVVPASLFAGTAYLMQRMMKKRLQEKTGRPANEPWPQGRRVRDMTPVGKAGVVVAVVAFIISFAIRVVTDSEALFWACFGIATVGAVIVYISERRRFRREGLDV